MNTTTAVMRLPRSLARRDATLVIIDMQPHFRAARKKRIINGCKEQIALAKRRGHAIIVVEYNTYGSTQPCLMEMLHDYNRLQVIKKHQDDGSREVLECLEAYNYQAPLIVCGVNWNACVRATVNGLSDKVDGNIYVVRRATGTVGSCNLSQWSQPNVKVCHEPISRRVRRARVRVLQSA